MKCILHIVPMCKVHTTVSRIVNHTRNEDTWIPRLDPCDDLPRYGAMPVAWGPWGFGNKDYKFTLRSAERTEYFVLKLNCLVVVETDTARIAIYVLHGRATESSADYTESLTRPASHRSLFGVLRTCDLQLRSAVHLGCGRWVVGGDAAGHEKGSPRLPLSPRFGISCQARALW
jgi:hypothetical protein